jgi:signal transduction histidine kinase
VDDDAVRLDTVLSPAGAVSPGGAPVTGPGWLDAARRFTGRRPLLVDTAGVLVLLLATGLVLRGEHGAPTAVVVVQYVLLVVPLVWRRHHPQAVFGVIALVAASQLVVGRVVLADCALLVALYTVASRCDQRRALGAALVLEAGVVAAAARWLGPERALVEIVFLSGMTTAAFVLGRNIRTRRAYLASLEDRALRAERERDQQSQIAAATERARIAREMHDIVAHNLSVMIALADGAAFAARTNSAGAESAARQVSDTGRQALAEMHRLLGVLREGDDSTPRAPQPGIDQLDDLVGQVRAVGLATSLTVTGQPFPLPPTAQLAVYRLVQEALTNVLKHADQPTQARVRLHHRAPKLVVQVADDGRGSARPAVPGGHGLAGMRERAAMFGGRVQAGPGPAGGWLVHAELDVGQAQGVAG